MSRVKADARPVDDPLLWQLDEPRALRPELDDGLFLRPIDLGAAMRARSYAADGRVVLGVTDETMPDNEGVYELVVEGGVVTCRPSDEAPELACSINEIGATYLGGVTWATLAAAGRVEERTPGALVTADAMFRCDRAPWPVLYF